MHENDRLLIFIICWVLLMGLVSFRVGVSYGRHFGATSPAPGSSRAGGMVATMVGGPGPVAGPVVHRG